MNYILTILFITTLAIVMGAGTGLAMFVIAGLAQ